MQENKSKESQKMTRTKRIQRFKEKCKGALKLNFIFFSALHITKIVIAAVYYDKCPVEPEIPKFLLALGVLGVVTKLMSLFESFLVKHIKLNAILSAVMTVELALLIVESYYVYREFQPDYDPLSGDKYCNKTLYLFSFIYITIVYCLLLLSVLIVGCFILLIVLLDKSTREDIDPEDNTTEVVIEVEQKSGQKQ